MTLRRILPLLVVWLIPWVDAAAALVFYTDFDSTLPAEITPGVATLTGVQGYNGLGPVGNQFGGNFLRSPTGNTVTLALVGLPEHDSISVGFLFAAIDSLDGTGTFPAGDFFRVILDGNQIFRESFANAVESQVQSYNPPPGVQLARREDLGFQGPGGFFTDSAYNMAADPVFQNIPHTASTAIFTFLIEGDGIQALEDESWAFDNLRVTVAAVPEPGTLLTLSGGLAALLAFRARRLRGTFHASPLSSSAESRWQ